MQPIVLQQVKLAGWSPAPIRYGTPSVNRHVMAQAAPVPVVPARAALIDSPMFNFFLYGLGAFSTGALAFGAAETKNTTASTILGIVTGGLALAAGYSLYSTQK